MESVKVFVQKDLTATVFCPNCRKSKRFSAADFKNKKHTVRVRCICNTKFLALLEFRNDRRRRVNLKGTFRTYRQDIHREGKMLISNISGGGLMCQVSDHAELEEGHILSLDYNLDNLGQRKISKLAIIRHRHGITVGCEFVKL
ncbi:MAG: PilZ domain-containing protein [Desulfofustis sp.]|nr:PilZ domain-containing protein [Desulfofustis sp.]